MSLVQASYSREQFKNPLTVNSLLDKTQQFNRQKKNKTKNVYSDETSGPSCTATGNSCCFHRERLSCFLLRRCALYRSSCSDSLASCRSDSRRLISDTTSSRTPPVPFQKGYDVSFSTFKKRKEKKYSIIWLRNDKTFGICLDSDC